MTPTDTQIRQRLNAMGPAVNNFVLHLYRMAYTEGQHETLERVQQFALNNEVEGTMSNAAFFEWLDAQRKLVTMENNTEAIP